MNNNNFNKIKEAYMISNKSFEKIIIYGSIGIGIFLAGLRILFKNPIMSIFCFALSVIPLCEVYKNKLIIEKKKNNIEEKNIELEAKIKKIQTVGTIVTIISLIITIILKFFF